MDQWLEGLEGILGVPVGEARAHSRFGRSADQTTLLSQASWAELDTVESIDLSLAGARRVGAVAEQHPWLEVCRRISEDQGFFHWELDFAPAFGRGGFDLQVGNPPWVRPVFDEGAVLAEFDPWWELTFKPSQVEVRDRRVQMLSSPEASEYYLQDASANTVVGTWLSSACEYPALFGLQPDLYRAFMSRTWSNSSVRGMVGLVHPESHFTEKRAATLRAESYRRLRRHWQFINELQLFDVGHPVPYGVHVYGAIQSTPNFLMASCLYHPDTVVRSLLHDGSGSLPGLKDDDGKWDLRPHLDRIIKINESVLSAWSQVLEEPGSPPLASRMVYVVHAQSYSVLDRLSIAQKIRSLSLSYSSGWHETGDRKKGVFDIRATVPNSWARVILQGPHFASANRFAKQPNESLRSKNDWAEIDLEAMGDDFIPRTSYEPSSHYSHQLQNYGRWVLSTGESIPVLSVPRIAWRRMASKTSRRSLYSAVIPAGAAHIHAVYSMGPFESMTNLYGQAGVLSSIVCDFLVRASGSSELPFSMIQQMPAFNTEWPLAEEIVERTIALQGLPGHFPDERHLLGKAAERRAAEIDIDALVALSLGLPLEDLCAVYQAHFPVLRDQDRSEVYDVNGRRVPQEIVKASRASAGDLSAQERTWVHPQSKIEYVFEFPFVSYDREEDMRKAYAQFEKLLAEKS